MAQVGWMVAILTALAMGQAPTDNNVYTRSDGTQCRLQEEPKREIATRAMTTSVSPRG
jgi:hypothetical protein